MGDPENPQDPFNKDPYGANDPNAQYNAGQYNAGEYDPYGQAPSYPGQGYPTAQPYPGGYPGYPVPNGEMQDPDNAMGIVGLVLNFVCCGPIGLIVSWIALNKSKERGYKNTVALVGAILGGVTSAMLLVVVVIYAIIFIVAISSSSSSYVLSLL